MRPAKTRTSLSPSTSSTTSSPADSLTQRSERRGTSNRGLEIVVRSFRNVNIGGCACPFDLYLDVFELFFRRTIAVHNDVFRVARTDRVAAGFEVQANRASRNKLLSCGMPCGMLCRMLS